MTTTSPPISADPRLPIPDSLRLPPTPRDFDILRMSRVLHVSTRKIADKHGISQTRVRQIVQRVCNWLAAALPVKTEAELEAEARLAQHLAADQLQRQIEQLQNLFDATGDPKYLRQQTRVITSLARLGVIPGAIDSLAADLAEGPLTGDEPQAPWSEDNPWANQRSAANKPLPTENRPLKTENPSVRACSPFRPARTESSASGATSFAATDGSAETSEQHAALTPEDLKGLQYMERRLLTLLESTAENNHDRRESLENTLASVREKVAYIELRISPHQPGAAIRLAAEEPSHV